jgi:hypothetical protein
MVANVGMTKAEDRTEAEYLEQIDSYLKGCEAHYPRVLDLFAANTLQPLVLNVTNNTAWNLPALVVELYVPGEVDGISPKRPAIDATDKFPAAPRSWGPRRSPMFDTYSDIGRTYPAMPASRGDRRPGPQIENGGSVRIKFPPHDLRPHAKIDLDPVVLLVDAPPGSTVTASWSATSTGVDGEVAGEVMLPVASQAMTLPHGKAQAGG